MGFSKIKYMPYLNFYLENIDRKNNELHVLYWNRDMQKENVLEFLDCNFHEFRSFQNDDECQINKIKNFLKYRAFAKKIINSFVFDFIIVLHTFPGILISDILLKYFKGKYIYDYRDITYETFLPFKMLIGRIIAGAMVTVVSSKGFRKYLPQKYSNKIYTSHNILIDSLNHRNDKQKYGIKSDKIRVAFWGFIRHKEINIALINKLSNDERFELHYYGREQQIVLELKEYVKIINANNIFFHGEYKPEERYEFIKNTDIIHNLYYDTNMLLAMGNKYYDGIIFKIPQICMPKSFMSEVCEKYKVGISISPHDELFADKLENYIKSMQMNSFYENCDNALEHVLCEYQDGIKVIRSLTNS